MTGVMAVLCLPCSYFGWLRRRLVAPLSALERTPPLQRYRKYHQKADESQGVGGFAACCIAINLVMGSGFLALPSAFVRAGLALSACVLAGVCLVMNVTVTHEVEVMCRAEAVLSHRLHSTDALPALPAAAAAAAPPRKASPPPPPLRAATLEYPLDATAAESEREPLKLRVSTAQHLELGGGGGEGRRGKGGAGGLRRHAYQVSELCELFGGDGVRRAYDIVMVLYMLCTLWGYSAVFGKALASNVPLADLDFDAAFLAYIALFAAVVVPLSVMDVREQVQFQQAQVQVSAGGMYEQVQFQVIEGAARIVMTWLRFATATAMTGSVAYAWMTGNDGLFPSLGGGGGGRLGEVPAVAWGGLRVVTPAVMFAVMLNSSSPVVVHALAHKPDISWVINVAMGAAFVLYASIGITVAAYFGSDVDDSCNVNWEGFGATATTGVWRLLSQLVGFFVVLFPALDVLSVYPLNVMVLANNLMAAVYHDRVDKAEQDRVIVAVFRLGCAVPPILAAVALNSLTQIVDYAGESRVEVCDCILKCIIAVFCLGFAPLILAAVALNSLTQIVDYAGESHVEVCNCVWKCAVPPILAAVALSSLTQICAVPPILAAVALNSLTQIVDYGGLSLYGCLAILIALVIPPYLYYLYVQRYIRCLAILIALVIPPYLCVRSRRECEARFGASATPYTMRVWSSDAACYAIMGVGLAAFSAQVLVYAAEIVAALRG
ncbi:hypothetical protein JKP88DRAFT_353407 [Tribonema minus]|uniref:Amino acid transporter n=1 Tax=Tribonema minus TaxID=303371 RepID=A0A836CJG5_9STRA|nr:hypothetical protein JKP88DRAFT_353407 [Tribonema minus]